MQIPALPALSSPHPSSRRRAAACLTALLLLASAAFAGRAAGAPRPDLVPQSVTAAPASLTPGASVTVTLHVLNQGAAAAPATVTRLRLTTSSTGTNSADLALADVPTPAVPAGSSVALSRAVSIPGSSPTGTYYIYAVVDNTDVAGQSDETNDTARSPALTVTAPATPPPTIASFSGDQTVTYGQAATLSVTPGGTGPFAYQWFFNAVPIDGATASSLPATAAGSYTVAVTNAGGTTTGGPATLTVNSQTAIPVVPPSPGTLIVYNGAFSASLPTVVITHGWQPTGSFNYTTPAPVAWQSQMASLIAARLNNNVNILLYTWPKAYTHSYYDPGSAFADVQPQGNYLATRLQALFGSATPSKIQFIGHSFGAFVNLYAVDHLSWHIDQFTMLDAPDNAALQVPAGFDFHSDDESTFRALLPASRVDFVDNYIATKPTANILLFGTKLPGSAPDGGEYVATDHAGMTAFYNMTIPATYTGGDGFSYSVLLGTANGEIPLAAWAPPAVSTNVLDRFTDVSLAAAGSVADGTDTVDGSLQDVIDLTKPASGGDATAEFVLLVPPDANKLAFDFEFTQPGAGDWLTVAFDGEEQYDFIGVSFNSADYETARLPIKDYAGQSGLLTVTLHSAASAASAVSVGNFAFLSLAVPVITGQPQDAAVAAGNPVTFAVTAAGEELTYQWFFNGQPITGATSATLTLNNVTTSQAGSYAVVVTNSAGSVTSRAAQLTVTVPPPTITSATTASGTAGTPFTYQIVATGSPTKYGVQGLPGGLNINTANGVISGTPQAAGTFTLTLNAYNASGKGSATLTLTVAAKAVPVVTSATTASGIVGATFSYQITATNNPTSYGVGGLPGGLMVNTTTGLISGTLKNPGTFPLTLNAYNAGGKGSATLTLTVKAPPVVTSPTTASGTVGVAFSYQIKATNDPTSYGVQGLPGGLAVNASTGLISGTPKTAGTYTLTLNVYNSAGKGSATLTLTVASAAPAITSATTAVGTVGKTFSYQITATNGPTSFGAGGLPDGLSVNASTGVISGTPGVAGTFSLTINAYNATGKGSATLTLNVQAQATPVITSALTASAKVGVAFSYQITASGSPTSYGVGGLPGGLTVNATTGQITGTPKAAGKFPLTLNAYNGAGKGSATLTLTITAP